MQPSDKYLIHADIRTSGVVERSDVVGAIFGQTEGLLGDELDLRDLQESSKLGRIDVDVESEGGRSFGTVTIASGLDRAETAVLAAALESIERVGPSRAECTVARIEDARAAKRREIVDRATELLDDLEETTLSSEQIVEEVRQKARIEEITTYEGLPAGPRVADSDAIIVVEGRADVRRLLKYGIKNAIAVEGTDVPESVAELTRQRNTTAFFDGDRGGDLILRELRQVGKVDYVAFAPAGQSVEDLDRSAILSSLRRKIPCDQMGDGQSPREAFAPSETDPATADSADETAGDGGNATSVQFPDDGTESLPDAGPDQAGGESEGDTVGAGPVSPETPMVDGTATDGEPAAETSRAESETDEQPERDDEETAPDAETERDVETLPGHVAAVEGTGTARLLDDAFERLNTVETDDLFETLADADDVPESVVLDGTLTQRLLDVAAQRGVGQIVATETGEFVKQPTNVRVRLARDLEVET